MYKVEEDPEENGLLVPLFINQFTPADEEEELYSTPWGKETRSITYNNTLNYVDHPISEINFILNTTHTCTYINSNNRGEMFSRWFIRDSISMFEVEILQ